MNLASDLLLARSGVGDARTTGIAGTDGIGECSWLLGPPPCRGRIRTFPADFGVDEDLGFTPSGSGPHFWLKIEKTMLNTQDVVHLLARASGATIRDIGVSGQKDRNAVTHQWFSVPLGDQPANREQRIREACHAREDIEITRFTRNQGKLKRGSHRRNSFTILIRDFTGDTDTLHERASRLRTTGFPNYFGPQRFGRGGKNLVTAGKLFRGELKRIDRMARSMALSSARSWIFNQVVSARMSQVGIDVAQIGDAMQLDGSNAFFIHDGSDPSVVDRIAAGDLHPTGPLWGGGLAEVGEMVAVFERTVAERYPEFMAGVEGAGMKHQRRALRVIPREFEIESAKDTVKLTFSLPAGAFATSLLRELVVV